MDIEQRLSQVERFIRQDQKGQARAILGYIIRETPENETAWILSAQVSDKPAQVLYCLRRALKIDPNNPRALALLGGLQQPQPSAPSSPAASPVPPPEPIAATPSPLPPPETEPPASAPEAQQETIYLQEANLLVSSTRLTFGETTLPSADLISVVSYQSKPVLRIIGMILLTVFSLLLVVSLGAFFSYIYLGNRPPALWPIAIGTSCVLLVGIVLGIFLIAVKPRYHARVTTAKGSFDVAASKDLEGIETIVRCIHQTIRERLADGKENHP